MRLQMAAHGFDETLPKVSCQNAVSRAHLECTADCTACGSRRPTIQPLAHAPTPLLPLLPRLSVTVCDCIVPPCNCNYCNCNSNALLLPRRRDTRIGLSGCIPLRTVTYRYIPQGHEDWAFWLQLTRLPLQVEPLAPRSAALCCKPTQRFPASPLHSLHARPP